MTCRVIKCLEAYYMTCGVIKSLLSVWAAAKHTPEQGQFTLPGSALRPPFKKVCFLSSGWPKLWPVGRPQYLFFFFGKKILIFKKKKRGKKGQNEKKEVPILQLQPHPAAGPETTFFLRVVSESEGPRSGDNVYVYFNVVWMHSLGAC